MPAFKELSFHSAKERCASDPECSMFYLQNCKEKNYVKKYFLCKNPIEIKNSTKNSCLFLKGK